jgi:hypothetical protein
MTKSRAQVDKGFVNELAAEGKRRQVSCHGTGSSTDKYAATFSFIVLMEG